MPNTGKHPRAEATEAPELDWLSRILSIVDKKSRQIILVMAIVGALGIGSFTAWATATNKVEDTIDSRIEAKTGEHFRTLETRMIATEANGVKLDDVKTTLIRLEQKVDDLKPAKQ